MLVINLDLVYVEIFQFKNIIKGIVSIWLLRESVVYVVSLDLGSVKNSG